MDDSKAIDILFDELEALERLQNMSENLESWQDRELTRIRDEIRKVRIHFDKR